MDQNQLLSVLDRNLQLLQKSLVEETGLKAAGIRVESRACLDPTGSFIVFLVCQAERREESVEIDFDISIRGAAVRIEAMVFWPDGHFVASLRSVEIPFDDPQEETRAIDSFFDQIRAKELKHFAAFVMEHCVRATGTQAKLA